jgi:hypothetical protein
MEEDFSMADQQLQYPIGRFSPPPEISQEHIEAWIGDIAALPAKLRAAVAGLMDEQLDTPYRPGGWTPRQVVHHVADSHMNCFIRFKLALTEDKPTIKPYDEGAWALLADSKAGMGVSLGLIEGLHERWVLLLRSMTPEQFRLEFVHPENGVVSLARATGLYSWHSRHHTAHITSLRERMGW